MSAITSTTHSSQIAIGLLTAQADANGSRATVMDAKLQINFQGNGLDVGSQADETNRLLMVSHELDRARFQHLHETLSYHERTSNAQKIDEASERAIERLKKRTQSMAKALAYLGASPLAPNQRIISLFSNTGSKAVAINTTGHVYAITLRGGDQALSIRSYSAESISTGGGHDAITIEAESVRYVRTDRTAGHEPGISKNGEPYARRVAETASNDAVAIKARHVDGVNTGGGNDSIAVQADLINTINAGDGRDAISLSGGVIGGVHGGAGDDVITVDAVLGKSLARNVAHHLAPFQDYTRPDSAVERLLLARTNYADVFGGAGNDTISVNVREVISIDGGSGDDVISIGSGTVGLRIGPLSGDDTVTVARGAEFVIEINQGSYTVERDGDDLLVKHAGGSVRVVGYEDAAAIGVFGSFEATSASGSTSATGVELPSQGAEALSMGIDISTHPDGWTDPDNGKSFRVFHMDPPEPVNILA